MRAGGYECVEPLAMLLRQGSPGEAREVKAKPKRLSANFLGGCHAFGRMAVASISTFASSSTRAPTCTSVIAGKWRPMTAR